MSSLRQTGFGRDVAALLVVTTILGSAAALGIARATSGYFARAIVGLIGDYGEYDVIVHVREDVAPPAYRALQQVVAARLPASRIKQGVAVAGKANFLIALAPGLKRADVFDSLTGTLSSVPGYSGYTIIMEPRATVRAMQPGSEPFFLSRFRRIPGVAVAFQNEGGIDVVAQSESQLRSAEASITDTLHAFRVTEVRFPMGTKVADAAAVGRAAAARVTDSKHGRTAVDITSGGTSPDLARFTFTLGQMRDFLLSYATSVAVSLRPTAGVVVGDYLALAPQARTLESDAPVPQALPVAKVVSVSPGGMAASAVIIRGDSRSLLAKGQFRGEAQAWTVKPRVSTAAVSDAETDTTLGLVGTPAGRASIWAQRAQLDYALGEAASLLGQFGPASAQVAQNLKDTSAALGQYAAVLAAVSGLTASLKDFSDGVSASTAQLAALRGSTLRQNLNDQLTLTSLLLPALAAAGDRARSLRDEAAQVAALQKSLARDAVTQRAAQALGGIAASMRQAADSEGAAGADTDALHRLESWKQRLPGLLLDVAQLDSIIAQQQGAATTLTRVLPSVESTLAALKGLDAASLQADVAGSATQLRGLRAIDTNALVTQLEYAKGVLPSLRDEDIGRSIDLIDSYLAGRVIPGERVVLLVSRGVSDSEVGKAITREAHIGGLSIVSTSPGSVEADIRAEVVRLLRRVRETIAALVAIVFVSIALGTDHATIASAIRVRRRYRAVGAGEPRRPRPRAEMAYCAAVGAGLMYVTCLLAAAAVPYVPRSGFAVLGAVVGLVVAQWSERLSPVNTDEMLAAEALGLLPHDVMRQVVIPASRPGLLLLLNKRRVLM